MEEFKSRSDLEEMTCHELIAYEAELEASALADGGNAGARTRRPGEKTVYDTVTVEKDEAYKSRYAQVLKEINEVKRKRGARGEGLPEFRNCLNYYKLLWRLFGENIIDCWRSGASPRTNGND